MIEKNKRFLDLSVEARSKADAEADGLCRRWHLLCERFLPVKFDDSVWRYNRRSIEEEPTQGWKLHISAMIIEACDLFEKVAPFLISEDVQFKAPNSLEKLSKINCGLQYGYHQVGKFITVYSLTDEQSVQLARQLHELTKDFFTISVPFDEKYLPESSVFYRYGAFSTIKATDENGETFPAIMNPAGELVPDDRKRAVPEWVSNPFPDKKKNGSKTFADTPLGETYRIFQAITQRGKGGTYKAVDLNGGQPRLCIVKEGRHNGELAWNGQDGYFLVKNEFEVFKILKKKYDGVPQIFDSFEVHGNFYFAMEYVGGKSLNEVLQPRRRRFSIRRILTFAIEIAGIIENIHRAGWIWNDCKPANLIVTKNKTLRPIDFEGAYPTDQTEPFDWKSAGFSNDGSGKSADVFALGAVIYFLLTGTLYNAESSKPIGKLRRNIPVKLIETTERLLFKSDLEISEAGKEFEKILQTI